MSAWHNQPGKRPADQEDDIDDDEDGDQDMRLPVAAPNNRAERDEPR